jgi:hypothetical protein
MKATSRTLLIALAMATILATVTTGAAVATKGGGQGHHQTTGGSGTISLVMVNDANGDTLPNYGDSVTFNVSTTVTDRPYVAVLCYQGTTQVYSAWAGFYPDFPWSWMQTFTLKSPAWTGGAADCSASLYYYNGKAWTTILSQGFQVSE